jgi:hypothetical protein
MSWRKVLGLLLSSACLLTGCGSPTEPSGPATEVVDQYRSESVLFTARARSEGDDRVEVTLTAMNETDFPTQVGILGGNCMLRPRLYTERGGRLVWSAFDLFDACPDPLRLYDLEGGASESDSRSFDVDVEDGDYFATVTIEAGAALVELAAGVVAIR